jgi:hypothetical protein
MRDYLKQDAKFKYSNNLVMNMLLYKEPFWKRGSKLNAREKVNLIGYIS